MPLTPEVTGTQAMEDVEMRENKLKEGLEESRWAQEGEEETVKDEDDKEMDGDDEQDEEEAGS